MLKFSLCDWKMTLLATLIRACLKIPLQNSLEKSSKDILPSEITLGSISVLISSLAFCLSIVIFSASRKSVIYLMGISLGLPIRRGLTPFFFSLSASSSFLSYFLYFLHRVIQIWFTISIWSPIL
jgi:hypothetical protein